LYRSSSSRSSAARDTAFFGGSDVFSAHIRSLLA
jgi:hypothetical protein